MDAATGALRRFLDAQRQRVFTVVDGLSEDALRRPALPSGWTCLQLVNHLAAEERLWFRGIVAGEPVALPESTRDDAAEWRVDPGEPAVHMIEEAARHLGHLDAARELLDGRTGLAQDRIPD